MQVGGGIAGAVLADAMFDQPRFQVATTDRVSTRHLHGELVATARLITVIFTLARSGRAWMSAAAVGAYIGPAYWFTSSTSFANPAVTVGREFSDTFTGIAPASLPGFVAVQLVGAALGLAVVLALYPGARAAAAGAASHHLPPRKGAPHG